MSTSYRNMAFLGKFLVGALVCFELVIIILILYIWFRSDADTTLYQKIAISLVLSWLGFMMCYYGWTVYFYNYNFGRSERFWENFVKKAAEYEKNGIKTQNELYEEMGAPRSNPYADETFGLPPGTVRGTLTLTILIGGLALTVIYTGLNLEAPLPADSMVQDYFEFFKDAFLMVVAFYFGTKGLDIIQRERTLRIISQKQADKLEEDLGLAKPATATETKPGKLPETSTISPAAPPPVLTRVDLKNKLINSNYPHVKDLESDKKLSIEDKEKLAIILGLDLATLEAVIRVESRGDGFLKDGRPIILFEGHVFWKQLIRAEKDPAQYADSHPNILYKNWTREFYEGGTREYVRLDEARTIHHEAALCSASWGLFQIMGYHFKNLDYHSIDEFVDKQYQSEYEHLEAFGRFIKKNNLIQHLQNKNWKKFARSYNGPSYETNQYDVKLEKFYNIYSDRYVT